MTRWLLAFVVASAAFAQSQSLKFDPHDRSAWEKAIRNPAALPQGQDFTGKENSSSHFALMPSNPGSPTMNLEFLAMPAQGVEISRFDQTCAIALTRIPADWKIDSGMRRDIGGERSLDNMPYAKTMPVCH